MNRQPLTLVGVSKTFSGNPALRGVSLTAHLGEVHALLGQNGSGKSTLIKILSGYHQPDAPTRVELHGQTFDLGDAEGAREAGLRFVHQDLGLVLDLSILENVLLGREYETGLGGRIKWAETAAQVRPFLEMLGVTDKLSTPVRHLSLAERAAVAIARALSDSKHDKLMIVLDEPTAALPPDEAGRLLQLIQRLRSEGHGILLVSHHLDEVLKVADRLTVLRDGRVVTTATRAEVDHDQLTEMIVGHRIEIGGSGEELAGRFSASEALLRIRRLSGKRLRHLEVDLRPGEIVGIAGITGSGREEVGSLLAGRLNRGGTVTISGQEVPAKNANAALRLGIAAIPGERLQFGLFPNFNVRENATVCDLARHTRRSRVDVAAERIEVSEWIEKLGIVTTGSEAEISSLSGGNQQKVLIARALRLNPKVLLLDDPTLGVDVGAREQILCTIEQTAADGMAVILVSTDSDELARLSHRVMILSGGQVMRVLERGHGLSAEHIDAHLLARGDVEKDHQP